MQKFSVEITRIIAKGVTPKLKHKVKKEKFISNLLNGFIILTILASLYFLAGVIK